ncbi:hypothetical protein SAMN04487974_10670 [Pelagibacterium luteolum]|uniref:Uncharacterized protein n=1 Tax=Pelagibacterium luteolum TaxID=440168 RepID=A0A1G7WCX8_9HYPH|nr:hypothetical protein SAMN04487974_10670 [Pelagibacterium luteolum]
MKRSRVSVPALLPPISGDIGLNHQAFSATTHATTCFRRPRFRRYAIPTDTFTLIGIGVAALVALWLVFSLVRKVFGFVLLAAIGLGAWYLWSNPETAQDLFGVVMDFF